MESNTKQETFSWHRSLNSLEFHLRSLQSRHQKLTDMMFCNPVWFCSSLGLISDFMKMNDKTLVPVTGDICALLWNSHPKFYQEYTGNTFCQERIQGKIEHTNFSLHLHYEAPKMFIQIIFSGGWKPWCFCLAQLVPWNVVLRCSVITAGKGSGTSNCDQCLYYFL